MATIDKQTPTEFDDRVSALTEIEYRTWWLRENLRDERELSHAILLEELDGIQGAVERERAFQTTLADTLGRATALLDDYDELLTGQKSGPERVPRLRLL